MGETFLGTELDSVKDQLPSREEITEMQIEWLEMRARQLERIENHSRFER